MILFSLKTTELLQNMVAINFQVAPLFSMRTVSLASLQSCRSVDVEPLPLFSRSFIYVQCSSPEPYALQHDSFNDSDPLFSEMDIQNLPDLPQACVATNKANVSCSKTNKPTPSRQNSESDIFTSNNSIPNRIVFGSSTKINSTHQTPQNFKTLSQVLSDHNYSPPESDELDINKPVATSRSLKDKLRKAMQENAKVC